MYWYHGGSRCGVMRAETAVIVIDVAAVRVVARLLTRPGTLLCGRETVGGVGNVAFENLERLWI